MSKIETSARMVTIFIRCINWLCSHKRYYYQRFGHKMPDSKGHAKNFFDPSLPDGSLNVRRNSVQFHNGGMTKPAEEDIVVFPPSLLNRYGQVAIISKVAEDCIEIIQQNPGAARETYSLLHSETWTGRAGHKRLMGWLRRP